MTTIRVHSFTPRVDVGFSDKMILHLQERLKAKLPVFLPIIANGVWLSLCNHESAGFTGNFSALEEGDDGVITAVKETACINLYRRVKKGCDIEVEIFVYTEEENH